MKKLAVLILPLALAATTASAAPITVVAAENFYGDVAKQIGGVDVAVTSILSNPDQDPHLFEASVSTARDLAGAKVVISNGIDYDPWIEKLLAANPAADRKVIVVADLVGGKAGDNPHLWYDPKTMPAVAHQLVVTFTALDPAHKADFEKREGAFVASLKPIEDKVSAMKQAFGGTPVTASEPVFGYMAKALDLAMRNESFQLAVMNNTEPSASDVAAFETDLKDHKVKVMLYNSQADDAAVKRLVGIAKKAGVPVVGITETEPANVRTYQGWMSHQLDALNQALKNAKS